jgi:hypothetical protein
MASVFPTTLDSFTDPTSTSKLNSPSHSAQHIDLNDAAEKIEARVGVTGSAVTTSLDYLIKSTAGGHRHSGTGTDGRKVLATNLDITGFTAYQSPRANSGATAYESFDSSTGTIAFVIDGGGGTIQTGVAGDLYIPFACTITAVTTLADQSGSIVVDIWKDTYASYPPTVADTITASAKPTLSGANKAQDSTLTGWTTSIAAGVSLRFNVDSCTTITRCLVSLNIRRS